MIDTPTLIVGLGGTGGFIAHEVWKNSSKKDRDFIGIHIFDTDRNPDSGLGRKEYEPLWEAGMITQTSPPKMVKECYQSHLNITQVENWFPYGDTIGQQPMTDGASQVRSVSRLALLDTIARGDMQKLNATIEILLKVRPQNGESAFRVLIVDTLAGGTGSGIFLQIAMYIRQYLESTRGTTNVVIRNVSMLPSIFTGTGTFSTQPGKETNIKANGYAAIKELDALIVARHETMSTDEKQFIFPLEMEYQPNDKDASIVATGPAPYETVFLFEHINSNSQSMTTVENYIRQVIDSIQLQLLSPLSGKINGQANNNARTIDKTEGRGRYASMGSATLRYPYEENIHYLALKWASAGLSDQWLTIDREWRKEVQDAVLKKRNNPTVEVPLRNHRYVELIDYKASGDTGIPFFKEIRGSLQIISKDEHGNEQYTEKVDAWIEALQTHVNKVIERTGNLKRTVDGLDTNLLGRSDHFISQVVKGDNDNKNLYESAKKIVETTASAVANDMFWSDAEPPYVTVDDEMRDKAGFRLNTWLLSPTDGSDKLNGLHPVAVRYFLYRAYAKVLKLLDENHNEVNRLRESLINIAKKYDDPNTQHFVETAVDRAGDLKNELTWFNQKSKLKTFSAEYITYLNHSFKQISQWTSKAIELEVLRKAKGTIEGMIKDWESFFDALENQLQNKLLNEIEIEERRHEASSDPMVINVLSSSEAKKRFWTKVSTDFAHESINPEICARLYISQYLRAVERHRQTPDTNLSKKQTSGVEEKLFREHVVAWCQAQLEARDDLKLDVATAIKKEFDIGLSDADCNSSEDWLRTRVAEVYQIAAVWIPPLTNNNAEYMQYWGLHNSVKDQMTGVQFNDLFNKTGDPVVSEMFSPFEIKRFAIIFAVSIADIPNFKRETGMYWKAYQEEREQTLMNPDKGMTAHVDKRWDSPAFLREMDNQEQYNAIARLRVATLYAVLHKDVEIWDEDNISYWRYYDNENAKFLRLSNGQPCPADLVGLFYGLATHYRFVEKYCELAESREKEARDGNNQLGRMPLIRNLHQLFDLLAEGVSTGVTLERKSITEQLLVALLDEVLACAIRYLGNNYPNKAIDKVENIFTNAINQSVELNKSNLSEAQRDIKLIIQRRPKYWQDKLNEIRNAGHNAQGSLLVYGISI